MRPADPEIESVDGDVSLEGNSSLTSLYANPVQFDEREWAANRMPRRFDSKYKGVKQGSWRDRLTGDGQKHVIFHDAVHIDIAPGNAVSRRSVGRKGGRNLQKSSSLSNLFHRSGKLEQSEDVLNGKKEENVVDSVQQNNRYVPSRAVLKMKKRGSSDNSANPHVPSIV